MPNARTTPARFDYRAALRAKGIRPLPGYNKLRTDPQPGDISICTVAGKIEHGVK